MRWGFTKYFKEGPIDARELGCKFVEKWKKRRRDLGPRGGIAVFGPAGRSGRGRGNSIGAR